VLVGTAYDGQAASATLLQFSSAFCAPCRATRRTLADVSSAVPGVTHVEVDAEEHLDLVRRWRPADPTTLVLDAAGARSRERASAATGAGLGRPGRSGRLMSTMWICVSQMGRAVVAAVSTRLQFPACPRRSSRAGAQWITAASARRCVECPDASPFRAIFVY
jgi:hypothetical protein